MGKSVRKDDWGGELVEDQKDDWGGTLVEGEPVKKKSGGEPVGKTSNVGTQPTSQSSSKSTLLESEAAYDPFTALAKTNAAPTPQQIAAAPKVNIGTQAKPLTAQERLVKKSEDVLKRQATLNESIIDFQYKVTI